MKTAAQIRRDAKSRKENPICDTLNGYAIKPPCGWDEDFTASESRALTVEKAWHRFCYPALQREAYEAQGFKAVPVMLKFQEV